MYTKIRNVFLIFNIKFVLFVCSEVSARQSLASTAAPDGDTSPPPRRGRLATLMGIGFTGATGLAA